MVRCLQSVFPVWLLLVFFSAAAAQHRISGRVFDSASGETLPACNIHVEGTYRGTISGGDGSYELLIPSLPARVVFRYVGYETLIISVPDASKTRIDVKLEPVKLALPEITVTGGDPAKDIMKKVIENKKVWRAKLETFIAEAYTRQSLQTDTMIASITESFSTAYWSKKNGSREVIKAKRQTRNLSDRENFAAASYIPNFYDDDITISNFKMVGPTHPDALDYYTFTLTDYQYIDKKLVFILDMKPRRKLQPTFVGKIRVLAESYALIDVDVKPGESVQFPPPIQEWNVAYRQQFSNFDGDFWLPVDVRLQGTIKVGLPGLQFPPITYSQISTVNDYQVNVPLPDSLYAKKGLLRVDSIAVANSRTFEEMPEPVPMTEKEQKAYEKLDSTQTFETMFKPKGALARFVKSDDEEINRGRRRRRRISIGNEKKNASAFEKFVDDFTPDLWYNRVQGGYFALSWSPHYKPVSTFRPTLTGAWNTHLERYSWATSFKHRRKIQKRNYTFSGGYNDAVQTRYESLNYNLYMNTVASLLMIHDYYDYFWSREAWLEASGRVPGVKRTLFTIRATNAYHTSLPTASPWNPFGINEIIRANPVVDEGWMRTLKVTADWGNNFTPFGIVGQKNFRTTIEHGSAVTGSDFSFTQVHFRGDYRLVTFYKRRFMPNVLDVRVQGSSYIGELPVQRHAALDGAITWVSPFGSFRTSPGNPLSGRHTGAVFWEHNFRTIPMEILGMKYLAKKGVGVVVFGNHGVVAGLDSRVWVEPGMAPSYLVRHEAGIGINGIFSLLRADITARLDRPGMAFTLTAARIF